MRRLQTFVSWAASSWARPNAGEKIAQPFPAKPGYRSNPHSARRREAKFNKLRELHTARNRPWRMRRPRCYSCITGDCAICRPPPCPRTRHPPLRIRSAAQFCCFAGQDSPERQEMAATILAKIDEEELEVVRVGFGRCATASSGAAGRGTPVFSGATQRNGIYHRLVRDGFGQQHLSERLCP